MSSRAEFYAAAGSVEHISKDAFAGRCELAEHRVNVGSTELFRHNLSEREGHLRTWPLSSSGETVGTRSSRSNEFLTVLSHELRNSLGAIRSAAGILGMQPLSDPAAVKARLLIERQVGQMSRLLEDLLDVSHVRSGQVSLHHKRIDLRASAAHAAQTVEFTMQQRNHRMTTSFPGMPVWLKADPARLEQVLVNLLFNAAKYTDSGGHIHLAVEEDKGEGVVRVFDNGIGIAPDVLPHIFDLFAQADPSSRRPDAGLGIGLAVVRSLVERHGGRVTVASTNAGPGHGSEFAVRLPTSAESSEVATHVFGC